MKTSRYADPLIVQLKLGALLPRRTQARSYRKRLLLETPLNFEIQPLGMPRELEAVSQNARAAKTSFSAALAGSLGVAPFPVPVTCDSFRNAIAIHHTHAVPSYAVP
jgi:hypothetical protein